MVSNYAARKLEVAKVRKVGACPECRQKEISVGSSVPQVQCTSAKDGQCRHALQPMPSSSDSVLTAVDPTSVTAQPAHATANFNAPASFEHAPRQLRTMWLCRRKQCMKTTFSL
jgi:hypothetical protein